MLNVPGIRMVIYWYMMYCDMWCIMFFIVVLVNRVSEYIRLLELVSFYTV